MLRRMSTKFMNSLIKPEDVGNDAGVPPAFNPLMLKLLWDRPEVCFEKYKEHQSAGKVIHDLVSKLRDVEQQYSTALLRIYQDYPRLPNAKFHEGTTTCNALKALLSLTNTRGKAAGKIASLMNDMLDKKKLLAPDTMLEGPSKQGAARVKDATKNMKKAQEKLDDKQKVMDKFYEKHKGAQLNEDRKKKEQVKAAELKEAQISHSMVSAVYHETLANAINSVQVVDFQRVDSLAKNIMAVSGWYAKTARVLWKSTMSARSKVRQVDRQKDLLEWARPLCSGQLCPWIEDTDVPKVGSKQAPGQLKRGSSAYKLNNPFSRASMVKLTFKKEGRDRSHTEIQTQAAKDAQKFEAIKSERAEKMKAHRRKEKEAALQAEKKQREQIAATRDQEIQQLQAEVKRTAEEREVALKEQESSQSEETNDIIRTLESEAAAKDRLLKELMEDKKNAEAQKAELEMVLAEMLPPPMEDGDTNMKGAVYTESTVDDGKFDEDELKTPIIIDNGSAYMKIGFSREIHPAFVVPSVVARYPHPQSVNEEAYISERQSACGATAQHLAMAGVSDMRINTNVFGDTPQSWDDLEQMWEYLFDCMSVKVRDHPVLLTQPIMAPLKLKERFQEIFFEKFDVPCMYVASAPVMAAYAYGQSSGLVVDIGHSSAQVVPLIDGFMMDARTRRAQHLGGRKDTERLVQFLKQKAPLQAHRMGEHDETSTRAHDFVMASNIKDRLAAAVPSADDYSTLVDVLDTVRGFVSGDGDAGDSKTDEVDPDDAQAYQKVPIDMQGELLKCSEVMFQPKTVLQDADDSLVSIPEMIADVVSKCDIDTRRTLLSNVFLSGGVGTMPGLKERLEKEIKDCLPHAEYTRVHNSESRFAAWVGGSVITTLEDFQDSWIWPDDWAEEKERIIKRSQPKHA